MGAQPGKTGLGRQVERRLCWKIEFSIGIRNCKNRLENGFLLITEKFSSIKKFSDKEVMRVADFLFWNSIWAPWESTVLQLAVSKSSPSIYLATKLTRLLKRHQLPLQEKLKHFFELARFFGKVSIFESFCRFFLGFCDLQDLVSAWFWNFKNFSTRFPTEIMVFLLEMRVQNTRNLCTDLFQ